MPRIDNLNISFTKRNQAKRGPTSSEQQNDLQFETSTDLARLQDQWNNRLVPLLADLPDDAFADGLDGKTVYVDADATSTVFDTTYWNSTTSLPNTLKEQFESVYSSLTTQNDALTLLIQETAGLTPTQKAAIGDNIFDGALSSSSSSLDGKSENNRLNITQIGRDVYGDSFILNNDGLAILDNSVKAMLSALLDIHNGNFSDDITVDHSGVSGVDVLDIVTISGNYVATSANHTILADTTSGDIALTLPAPSSNEGKLFRVKKLVAANNLNVSGASGNIDDLGTDVISSQYAWAVYQSDGSDYWIVG